MADEKRQKHKTKKVAGKNISSLIQRALAPSWVDKTGVHKAIKKEINRQKQKGEHKEIDVFKSKKAKGGRITKSKGGRAR